MGVAELFKFPELSLYYCMNEAMVVVVVCVLPFPSKTFIKRFVSQLRFAAFKILFSLDCMNVQTTTTFVSSDLLMLLTTLR